MIPLHSRCLLIVSAILLAGCKPAASPAPTTATAGGGSAASGSTAPSGTAETVTAAAANDEWEPLPTRYGVTPALQKELRKLIADDVAQHQGTTDDVNRLFKKEYELLLRPAYEFEVPVGEEWHKTIQDQFVLPARKEFDGNDFFKKFKIVLPKWADPLKAEYEAGTISGVRRELLFAAVLSKTIARGSALQTPPKGQPPL